MGWKTRTNSNTSTASTMRTPAAMAIRKLVNNSFMNSVSPVSTKRTPLGKFFKAGKL